MHAMLRLGKAASYPLSCVPSAACSCFCHSIPGMRHTQAQFRPLPHSPAVPAGCQPEVGGHTLYAAAAPAGAGHGAPGGSCRVACDAATAADACCAYCLHVGHIHPSLR